MARMISSASLYRPLLILSLDVARTLARICLFRANPQDLPASRELLVGCVAATLVVLFIGYRVLVPNVSPVALAALHTFLLGFAWIILLQVTGNMVRWYQSASAIYGSAAIVNLVTLPIVSSSIASGALVAGERPGALSFMLISLWVWEVAVIARIVRESIGVSLPGAIGLSLLMSFAIQFAMVSLFSLSG